MEPNSKGGFVSETKEGTINFKYMKAELLYILIIILAEDSAAFAVLSLRGINSYYISDLERNLLTLLSSIIFNLNNMLVFIKESLEKIYILLLNIKPLGETQFLL